MHRFARSVDLVEFAREKRRTVEARVKRAVLIRSSSRDFDTSQHVVPAFLCPGLHRFEIIRSQLRFEVSQGLLRGDERRGHADRHLLATHRRKVYLSHGVVTFDRFAAFGIELSATRLVGGGGIGQLDGREGLVEADDEPVAEILGHAAAVTCRIAGNGLRVDDLHARAAVEGVDDHARLRRFGEREAHHGGALRRGHFGHDVVVGQIDRVIIRFRRLRLVREPALTRLLAEFVPAPHGHQRKLPVVIDPRRGLVGLFEAPDGMRSVGVGPPVAHRARLGRPEIHSPRQSHRRIGIARRERIVRLGADQRRDVFRGANRGSGVVRNMTAGSSEGRQHDECVFLHYRMEFNKSALPSFTSLSISSPNSVFCHANHARV